MQHKIVIADCDHDGIDIELSVFREHGLECDLRKCISEDEVIEGCADATILLIQYARISRRVLEALPNIALVVRYGVGFDTVDIAAARDLGVQVCNIPDYSTNEVADHAVAHTLCLQRKLYMTNSNIRMGSWNYLDTVPIKRINSQTVGIIGVGRIGAQYAKRMNAFGAKIIAADPTEKDVPEYVESVSLNELLRRADIISIHCPADGNKDLIGDAEFAIMKDGVYLINTARGGIVNEDALLRALQSKKLGGYGLDVAESEPIGKDHPLLKHENVVVSPHNAWYSEESAQELKLKVALEATSFAKGEKLRYPLIRFDD